MSTTMAARRLTIRRQLTSRLLLAFGVPLVLAGLGGFVIIRANLLARLDASLLARAEAIATATTWDAGVLRVDTSPRFMREFDAADAPVEHDESADRDATRRSLTAATAARDLRMATSFFEIRGAAGELLAHSASLDHVDGVNRLEWPTLGDAAASGTAAAEGSTARSAPAAPAHPMAPRPPPMFWNVTLPSGVAGRALAFPFVPRMPHEGSAPGPIDVVLVVAVDRQDLDRTLRLLALVFSSVGLLLAATIVIAVSTGLRRGLTPLDTLADRASRIDARSLGMRFDLATLPGELIPIAGRLNDLLSRLEHAFDRERQFSADVAHELRTPIAELRALAELSLKWPDARGADSDRDTLAIARQMEGIVSRLLALLRSERDQLPIAREPIALAPLLRDTWQPFADRAAARHLDVTWHLRDDFIIDTDPVLLRSILTNLIENAVDYTPQRGTIDFDLQLHPDEPAAEAEPGNRRFALRIANTVEHLTPADVPKLFDRFWRHDAARNSAEHSGLGLSLAQAFAQALRYDLTATLATDAELVLTLAGRFFPD